MNEQGSWFKGLASEGGRTGDQRGAKTKAESNRDPVTSDFSMIRISIVSTINHQS
jgi:hypothetical protein